MTTNLALHGAQKARSAPFPSWPIWGREEEEALLRVLHSGRWGRLDGLETEAFEKAFAAYQDARHGIAVVNGSVALKLALLAVGVQAGDEVIVPPYTFLATASSVIEANAVPVFADIEPDSYCIDPKKIEEAITPRTRAIIPVHMSGQAADMDRIRQIAGRHSLAVIEDAAHAHGAEYKGRKLGSLGDFGAFSFQASKNLNSGEGGMILANDDRLAELARSFHNCGREPGRPWYHHVRIGGNNRLGEFQSAVLSCQLARLPEQTRRRNANGLYLNERLSHIPGIRPLPRDTESVHSYHTYIFRFDEAVFGCPRERFVAALDAEGIPCMAGYPIGLYEMPVFAEKNFGPYSGALGYKNDVAAQAAACPVTEHACKKEACWLTQATLLGTSQDMDDIVHAIEKIYENRRELNR